MKYPEPLKVGSRIAITAVSSGVPEPFHPRLDIVIAHLQDLGFEVIEGQCLRSDLKHASASAQARANELMAFLCDDSIAAVAPPWGGEFAIDILPLLDYEKLQTVKPKWFFGFSDVSTVAATLMFKLGWATVHCANLMQLHPNESDKLTTSTLSLLNQAEGARFVQLSSDAYQLNSNSFDEKPHATLNKTELTKWKVLGGANEAHFSGRLVGGCFDTIIHLLGTEYFQMEALRERFKEDGLILYLESAEMSPTFLKRALLSFKYKGVFDHLNGFLFGRNAVTDKCGKDISCEEAFLDVAKDLAIPIVYDVDIGHLPPNITLFNGAFAEVNVTDGRGRITQILS